MCLVFGTGYLLTVQHTTECFELLDKANLCSLASRLLARSLLKCWETIDWSITIRRFSSRWMESPFS